MPTSSSTDTKRRNVAARAFLFALATAIFFPAVARAQRCGEQDAAPAIAAWTDANARMKNGDYPGARASFAKVVSYFGSCASQDERGWQKYNHTHWEARAEYLGGVAAYLMGDEVRARAMLASARAHWTNIIQAGNIARAEDVESAKNSIAKLDGDIRVWDETRAKTIVRPPTPQVNPPLHHVLLPTTEPPNCRSIIGTWRASLPAGPRSYKMVDGLLTFRDVGGNDFEGTLANADWQFHVSFAEVRYTGRWIHAKLDGRATMEISVSRGTAEMRGTLEGMPSPPTQGPDGLEMPADQNKSSFLAYKSC